MTSRLKSICTIIVILCCQSLGYSQSKGINFSSFLEQTMNSHEEFWVRVHAAEALLDNNFTIDAKKSFKRELQNDGEKKIGALRVVAKQSKDDSVQYRAYGKEILKQFHETKDRQTRLIALESLGKLSLYFSDSEIRQIASSGSGGIQTLAQWVLSHSGDPDELSKLVKLLSSPDSTQFRYAAYALRFKDELSSKFYNLMKERYQELSKTHPFRVYLVSSLWVHAPTEEEDIFKKKLLEYRDGQKYEQYEVFQAFSIKGSRDLLSFIKENFEDKNEDVQVSIAQAYLANEHFLQSDISWVDWFIIFIYGILLLGIGWFYSFFQRNKEDYFLGGGTVNPIVSGISMYVSFFSAITYLAIVGEVIKYGPLFAFAAVAGAPIIFALGSYFLIPYFMNLKMISAYEILEKPLGKTIRNIGSVIFLITRILWMALLIFLASKAMVVMMGWDDNVIIIITIILGIITILYTTLGGLKAVLATDAIQFAILLLGAVLTIGMVASEFNGVSNLIPTSWDDNWQSIDLISFDPYIRLTVFFAFINTITWWFCTTGSDQMAIQRFLSTKNLKAARQSFFVTQLGMIIMTLVLVFVGFSVMKFYDTNPNLLPAGTDVVIDADFLFPHFIANQFPIGMSGLVIAALFSASMSSLSSGINSTSSVLSEDILPSIFETKHLTDNLKSIRLSSGIIGLIVILLSIIIPAIPGNIIEVTAKTNGLFIAPLFNLFFMALFVKSAKPFGVVIGSTYGLLTAFIIAFWDVLTGNPPLSFLWIAISSLVVSVLSSLLFGLIFSNIQRKKAIIWSVILLVPWAIIFFLIIR